MTWRRETLYPRVTLRTHTSAFAHAYGHVQKIFRKRHVCPLSEKNNAQSGSRRTRVTLLIWRGLEGVTCVYGIRSGRHSNPMLLPCQGMFMGESLLHFYSILRLMRSEIYARFRARIFSWPWFANEKRMGNYPCDLCNREMVQIFQKRFSHLLLMEIWYYIKFFT